jgi:hypothetical protein
MRKLTVVTLAIVIYLVFAVPAHAKSPKLTNAQHRNNVVKVLRKGLASTPLRGTARIFESEGWRAKMSPYFLVGASGTESSFGAAACSGNSYNIWGLGACNRAWIVPYFSTRRQAVRYYVKFIRSHWPSAKTCYQLYGYCPPCGAYGWGSTTHSKMRQLFGPVSSSLTYPRKQ